MSQDVTLALQQLGREAAQTIAGAEAVREVEVVPGYDSDRPVYYFSFLIDQDRAQLRSGLLLSRLVQKLRDELIS
jgi:hypothetical protein